MDRDLDVITEAHEKIGYEKGYRDGCAQSMEDAEQRIVALYRKEHNDSATIFNTAIDACQSIILDLFDNKAVEVPERNVGKWIYWDKNRVMCSECKLEPYAGKGADSFKYCPHCGAKMEE